jgi:hypothetical protein
LLGAEKKAKGAGTEWEEKRQNKAESFFPFSLLFFSYFVVRLRLHRPELAQGLWGRHLEFLKKSSLLRARVYFSLSTSACGEEADEREKRGEREARRGERSESGRAIEFLCKVSLVRFFVSFQTPPGKRPFPRSLLLLLLLLLSSPLPTALPLLPTALYFISF